MEFQDEDIKKLAALSRLSLTQHDTEKFREQLTSILQYVDQVTKVSFAADDESVEAKDNVTRPDKAKKSDVARDDLLKAAPSTEEGYVSVRGMR